MHTFSQSFVQQTSKESMPVAYRVYHRIHNQSKLHIMNKHVFLLENDEANSDSPIDIEQSTSSVLFRKAQYVLSLSQSAPIPWTFVTKWPKSLCSFVVNLHTENNSKM